MGCFTVFFAPVVFWLLPNSPTTARFLSKGDDRLVSWPHHV